MMGSLRNRLLLSSFVIFFSGILLLGAWLSYTIYQRETTAIGEELERTALDMLGYIEFTAGTFQVTGSESDAFIDAQHLRQNGKERFAYLWDVDEQKIIWDSVDNDDVDQQRVTEHFALFDFAAILQNAELQGQGFIPADARKMYSVPQATGEEPVQYMVAAQKFSMNIGGNKKPYLFIVATSVADIEADIHTMLKAFTTVFFIFVGLLLIAQFALNLWVVAPIKKLEQEANAVGSGTKTAIDAEYPQELTAIKRTINALLAQVHSRK